MQEELKNVPGIQFVDHVAIAVKQGELDGQVKAYEALGFEQIHREEVRGKDQVREALLKIGEGPNLAHVAFRVANARQAFDAMRAAGFQLIDEAPRKGSRGTTVFFVHPKSKAESAFGILIEMVEDPASQ